MKIGETKIGDLPPDLNLSAAANLKVAVTLEDLGKLVENRRKRASYTKRIAALEEEDKAILQKYVEAP